MNCIVCRGKIVEDTRTIEYVNYVTKHWWSPKNTLKVSREETHIIGYHCEDCGLMYKFIREEQ